MTSYRSTLTRKGQATIPIELREKLGLKEGDRIVWWIEDGQLRMMGAQAYVRQTIAEFEALAESDPNRPSLTNEELKEATEETWTDRYSRAAVQR